MHLRALIGLALVWASGALSAVAASPVRLVVDLREMPQGLVRCKEVVSVAPGPCTLLYAKWIPGEHSPSGPFLDVVGLKFLADGKPLAWERDREDLYALKLEIPAGVTAIEASFDYLSSAGGPLSARTAASPQLGFLNWHWVTLYPKGQDPRVIEADAEVLLPDGWSVGSSLQVAMREGNRVVYASQTLEMLFDQPILTGRHFAQVALTPGRTPEHFIELAADAPEAMVLSPQRQAAFSRLIDEVGAITGLRPYRRYHFLLGLSEKTGYNGLEHHQTSENRGPENALTDDQMFKSFASLLPHEYFHSWNGKFRRPLGLLSPDYQKPMEGDLLWVYEGLTEYYGNILTVRSGLLTPEYYREYVAANLSGYSTLHGRTWRSLEDNARVTQWQYMASHAGANRRRGVDIYGEGDLLWLEVDAILRAQTGGTKSLDDFVRKFFGDGGSGPVDPTSLPGRLPTVSAYEEADLLDALNAIVPYDWKEFFAARVHRVAPQSPEGGVVTGGWRLVYNETVNEATTVYEQVSNSVVFGFSLGFSLSSANAQVEDVRPESPAGLAGLAPGMIVIGVNGRKYTPALLKSAVTSAKESGEIQLLVEDGSFYRTLTLKYKGGLIYPHLERVSDRPDFLSNILTSRVSP